MPALSRSSVSRNEGWNHSGHTESWLQRIETFKTSYREINREISSFVSRHFLFTSAAPRAYLDVRLLLTFFVDKFSKNFTANLQRSAGQRSTGAYSGRQRPRTAKPDRTPVLLSVKPFVRILELCRFRPEAIRDFVKFLDLSGSLTVFRRASRPRKANISLSRTE